MRDLPDVLREALPASASAAAVRAAQALRETYRSGAPPRSLAIPDDESAAAYAAYRMPATSAAVAAALEAGPGDLGPAPVRHLDLGGGTGAATWAVHARWPDAVSSTVLDASPAALALGADLAHRSDHPRLVGTRWEQARFDSGVELPTTDLVTACYLLGELSADVAQALVGEVLKTSRVLLVVEPGTPRGYEAVLAGRGAALAAGWRIVAPCPHALACPLTAGDWCHDSVRLQRSTLHRQLKSAELGHEDEKFSYLYAVAPDPGSPSPVASEAPSRAASDSPSRAASESPSRAASESPSTGAAESPSPGAAESPSPGAAESPSPGAAVTDSPSEARVLRHPLQRKGMVQLRVCRPDGTVGDVIISKRHGDLYRRARDTEWGDSIPLP